MSTGNKRTLTISIGKENQYKTENITKGNIDNSFFAEQYRESLKVIDAYLGHLPKCTSGKCNKDSFGEDKPNNIIAFVGDRGSGKTSCMESVAKYLKENNKELEEYKEICSRRFYAFDMIEPAFFDDKHNVVSLVIASLYKEFCKESGNLYRDHEKKLSVAKCFSKVQEELEWMVGKAPETVDNFDKLANQANAVSLKQDIGELIDKFLDYMGYKDSILLLHIDDIDLNTRCADVMTESIRKYLIQYNILVLISVKIEQLEKVKQLAYVNEYKNLLDKEEQTGFTHENIKDMVDKFVTKFLPRVQRIHMPELSSLIKTSLTIIEKDKEREITQEWWKAVCMLIKEKTSLSFYNIQNEINRIVPRNLRELCQFVRQINDMTSGYDILENKQRLTNYLLHEWAEKHLSSEKYNAIQAIVESANKINFNKVVAGQLYNVFKKTIDEWHNEIENEKYAEACAIVDRYNKPNMVTLGDVFGVIFLLEEVHNYSEDKDFFFLVKFVYTSLLSCIRLPMNLGINPRWYENGKLPPILSDYRNLIGGNFINSTIIETMPTEGASGMKRSMRKIDLGNLRTIARETTEADDIDKIHLLEIFVLCIGRNFETKYDKLFRKRGNIEYDKDLQDVKEAYFDVNSYMYNVIDLDTTYKRVGVEFYEYVKNNNDSLYNKLLTKQQRTNFASEEVLINSAEVLMLLMRILSNYKTYKGTFVYNLWAYFDRITGEASYLIDGEEYEINTIIGCSNVAEILKPLRDNSSMEEFAQRILNASRKDALILIERLSILKRRQDSFVSSKIKYNIERTHQFFKDKKNKNILDKIFVPNKRFTKEQIRNEIEKYNNSLQ